MARYYLALLIGIGLLLTNVCSAAEIKLPVMNVGSQVFSNVTITSASATDVYFLHSKGVSNAKIRNLEPEVQKLLNYDAAAAKAAEKRQDDAEKGFQGSLAAAVMKARGGTNPPVKAEPDEFPADAASERTLLGKHVAGLDVEKWIGKQPKLDGKFVLVSFWTTKSPAARRWIPTVNAWQAKFAEKLQAVALTTESEREVQAFVEPKIEFATAIDSKGKLMSIFGVTTVPYVLLLDPKGTVLYYGHPAALTEKHIQTFLAHPPE